MDKRIELKIDCPFCGDVIASVFVDEYEFKKREAVRKYAFDTLAYYAKEAKHNCKPKLKET